MQIQYLIVEPAEGRILGATWRPDPNLGPIVPQGDSPIAGTILVQHDEEFTRAGRSDTEIARWVGGAIVWSETVRLADVIVQAIERIDSAADAARLEILSKQTNTEEYKRAEQQARAYRAVGYPVYDIPSCVSSWAKAKWRDEWTAQQAADDIIATADRWYALLDGIRDLRLCAKEDVRHAADLGEITARAQQFSTDLINLMKGVS